MAKDSTVYLQAAIQALHDFIAQEHDPQDVRDASQCFARLQAIQQRHLQPPAQGPQGPQAAVMQQLPQGAAQ